MTGLYQNYRELTDVKNEKLKGCTFLTRTLEREIPPLDDSQMAVSYFNTFDIEETEAIKLAKKTKGYAFAYQVLGYWYFEKYVNKNERVKDVDVEYKGAILHVRIRPISQSRFVEISKNKTALDNAEFHTLMVKECVLNKHDNKPFTREQIDLFFDGGLVAILSIKCMQLSGINISEEQLQGLKKY